MKRKRPIPSLGVKLIVARRQIAAAGLQVNLDNMRTKLQLHTILLALFGGEKAQIDHDPALILRDYDEIKRLYSPDANDPEYLVYRSVSEHRVKTFVHGKGAHRSDIAERQHRRRMDENRGLRRRRPKQKIPQRFNFKWPKRKFINATVKP